MISKRYLIGVFAATLSLAACGNGEQAAEPAQATADEGKAAADVVQLPRDAAADIEVEALTRKRYPRTVEAPGEVKLNAYNSAQVTPRVAAQVVARHARLGESVKKGQILVTLSSVEVANAQGALRVAAKEWSRLRRLGKSVVGEKRYVAAQVAYRNAWAALAAYGLNEKQIDQVESRANIKTRGQLELTAPLAGSVLRDDFVVGEYVNAGRELFQIADLSTLWVEAEVAPAAARTIAVGSQASVHADSVQQTGKVVQKQPSAQASTRTVGIRVEVVRDAEHPLYPGDFVQVRLHAGMSDPVLAAPEAALVSLPDGAWAVFVRVGTRKYRQQQVRLGQRLGKRTVIEGVDPGTEVVTKGAFYLASELGKAGFGDDD